MYRVRKTWLDVATQKGAFNVLDYAKKCADDNKAAGYKVFDPNGIMVYDPMTPASDLASVPTPNLPLNPSSNTTGMTSIMGDSLATVAQMTSLIRTRNPNVSISVINMLPFYLSEGRIEGVRGDIAFAQSCIETGNFTFSGGTAVTLDQNNFCGMGVTSLGVKGNFFDTPQMGIRAQIQHLKAYGSIAPWVNPCISPRAQYVTRGVAPFVEWLGAQENPKNMGWAYGAGYGKKILNVLNVCLALP
jgi:hypothetical protein